MSERGIEDAALAVSTWPTPAGSRRRFGGRLRFGGIFDVSRRSSTRSLSREYAFGLIELVGERERPAAKCFVAGNAGSSLTIVPRRDIPRVIRRTARRSGRRTPARNRTRSARCERRRSLCQSSSRTPQGPAFCRGSSGTSRWPRKKIASTLLRLGPPLAGMPVVISGCFATMLESVRMYVSYVPDSYPRRSMTASACDTDSCWAMPFRVSAHASTAFRVRAPRRRDRGRPVRVLEGPQPVAAWAAPLVRRRMTRNQAGDQTDCGGQSNVVHGPRPVRKYQLSQRRTSR